MDLLMEAYLLEEGQRSEEKEDEQEGNDFHSLNLSDRSEIAEDARISLNKEWKGTIKTTAVIFTKFE